MSIEIFKLYALLSFIGLLSVIIFRALSAGRTNLRLPPSPLALPIIGHLHLLAPIPHQALHKLSLRYGPIVSIRLGSVPCVVASSAEAAREFLKTHELSFAGRPQSKAISRLTYGSADFSFAPYNSYWRFMKKLCITQLLGGPTLEQLQPVRREETQSLIKLLFEKSEKREAVDIGAELTKLTNNVVCRMTMSSKWSTSDLEAEEARKVVKETAELFGKFNFADFIGFCKNLDLQGFDKRLEDLHRRFDLMLEKALKKKEDARRDGTEAAKGRVKDLLDILLDIACDETAEMKLTRDNIKAFILDIFGPGTDNPAIAVEWAMAELINHPNIFLKARDEIDTAIGKGRMVEESDVPSLPYLQAIVKETLRLHPIGPLIVRESTQDCIVDGYDIPARTRLFVNVWAIGRDPNHWPEPLEFKPERFVESDKGGIDVRGQHFHMLPFGSGRRGCPGASLALHVIQPTLAAMIQCFDWTVDGGHGTVDMTEGPGITLPRAQPLLCRPVARLGQELMA